MLTLPPPSPPPCHVSLVQLIFDYKELLPGLHPSHQSNDHTVGWRNLNLLSHPNAKLVLQARQASASGENLNYVTLAPQVRPSGEVLNYLLSH